MSKHTEVNAVVGLVKCEVCGEPAQLYVRDLRKTTYCRECGEIIKDEHHDFCYYDCLKKWLENHKNELKE